MVIKKKFADYLIILLPNVNRTLATWYTNDIKRVHLTFIKSIKGVNHLTAKLGR